MLQSWENALNEDTEAITGYSIGDRIHIMDRINEGEFTTQCGKRFRVAGRKLLFPVIYGGSDQDGDYWQAEVSWPLLDRVLAGKSQVAL